MTDTAIQLKAMAQNSDGATSDVTAMASWESSNPFLATVSSTGLVAVLASGDVDFRATYQGVTGALRIRVGPSIDTSTVVLSGVVREASTMKLLPGARVVISSGPAAGASTMSNEAGRFSFLNLSWGDLTLTATKDGYLMSKTASVMISGNSELDVWMFPVPPTNASGVTATARCLDGSWTWDQTRTGACDNHEGIAYPTCPGPLCLDDTSLDRRGRF